jgi:predicted RecB family nuclease
LVRSLFTDRTCVCFSCPHPTRLDDLISSWRLLHRRRAVVQRRIVRAFRSYVLTQDCFALPISSYGLKSVEKYLGYKRTQTNFGGDWSISQYVDCIQAENKDAANELLAAIVDYNREDIEATWFVFNWLKDNSKI